jgi:iron complex outermembrane receptor protein
VISGPGGTLWGVNAFNGIINVITRSADATDGALGAARLSNRGGDLAFRMGQRSGTVDYRLYGKVFQRSHNELSAGGRANDDWRQGQFGFRADWGSGSDTFSVNGNVYRSRQEQPEPGLINVSGSNQRLGIIRTDGANITGRWDRRLEQGGTLSLQAYIDHTRREVPPSFTESLDIADLQFQHILPAIGRHNLVWGANYRYSWDNVENSAIIAFLPAKDRQSWISMFGRDEVVLRDDLRLTLGVRVERSPYTKAEVLPNARLAWKPADNHLVWIRTSRALRAPSRLDVDAFIPGRPPFVLAGGPAVRSEVGKVLELGYRGQPMASLSYSVAVFHNRYDHLRTQELLPGRRQVAFTNLMEGHANGLEAWGNWQANARWRLSAGLTLLKESFHLKAGSNDVASLRTVGRDPAHTAQLRSTWVIDDDREVDVAVRRVGPLGSPAVPGYTALDARYGWRLRPGLELSVSGQNLNGSHPEFGAGATRIDIPRTVAVKLVWQN